MHFEYFEKESTVEFKQRNKLAKYAKVLRQISKIRSEEKARDLLVQKGGAFLPLVLPPLLAVAASLFGDLISRSRQ